MELAPEPGGVLIQASRPKVHACALRTGDGEYNKCAERMCVHTLYVNMLSQNP